jgi:hypothetical protein
MIWDSFTVLVRWVELHTAIRDNSKYNLSPGQLTVKARADEHEFV